MYYNEAYEQRRKHESALLKKWDKALNANGGIKSEHMARNTAIVLENYLNYLHSDPRLIAEDQIKSSAFTGVNLALLGLIARVIPNIIGAELVGLQAMPTPKSPIFTMKWVKDNDKARSADGDELFVSPIPSGLANVGIDPYYSSQLSVSDIAGTGALATYSLGTFALSTANLYGSKINIMNGSVNVAAIDASNQVVAQVSFQGSYLTSGTIAAATVYGSYDTGGMNSLIFDTSTRALTGTLSTAYTYELSFEYYGEAEPNIPEISFSISEQYVSLIRRQLRGKYTLDAAYDLKTYHGINLDSELAEMMKTELTAEINREIVADLRRLAGTVQTLDYNVVATTGGITISGRYEDAHRITLDAINKLCARIWNIGRLGYGNWVLGNPETLSFLDRVPGFVGSGVVYDGKDITYTGSLGGKIKFYRDPNYPKGELLIGYKGPGALDTGYVHCPYLPITATPTIINQETGDPSKIFYTRYGKTFYDKYKDDFGTTTIRPKNLILMGEYQYARLILKNFPTIFQ